MRRVLGVLGAVALMVALCVSGCAAKALDKSACIERATASGVGYQWTFLGGCYTQNPWTGQWSHE